MILLYPALVIHLLTFEVCSNPLFSPLKTARFHIDGRKIIRVLKMLKDHEMSDSEKKEKRGLIYQRLLDIVKVFNEENVE